ncbi:unnamed protein product [Penicillium roqueforti FM164]|uniref:Genomic scaffold, ProqFM164S03 n=1 Tax=Penicillium roqueforti (strain FM164) TaxID=1365484 RepID=W6QKC0_PENRF|nr:unnamed protein product [Penicillium roqueforti FM164]
MPGPFPLQILYKPARIALEALLFLRMDSPLLSRWTPPEDTSHDARLLLDVCKDLRNSRVRQQYLDEKLSLQGDVFHDLSYGTVLMLAVITWHFDASSSQASQGLITFLRKPHDIAVREILEVHYRRIMCDTAPPSFDFLLFLY